MVNRTFYKIILSLARCVFAVWFFAFLLCRGECVRLKHFVTNSFVTDNVITNCGIYDYQFDNGGKNGEAVYVGTSSKQVRRKP